VSWRIISPIFLDSLYVGNTIDNRISVPRSRGIEGTTSAPFGVASMALATPLLISVSLPLNEVQQIRPLSRVRSNYAYDQSAIEE
jgi:hypothetical protein